MCVCYIAGRDGSNLKTKYCDNGHEAQGMNELSWSLGDSVTVSDGTEPCNLYLFQDTILHPRFSLSPFY